jgi:ubiquinone/menaquinone biosynthesis C-methylase UbiE
MFWRKQRETAVEKDERGYGQLYDTKVRLASYWHQIDETRQAEPRNVLEIGPGSGFVSRYLDNYYHLTTVDISLDLFPKCIGSVLNLPFKDKTFDVTLCCQVLEHLPFSKFERALDELSTVTCKRVVLSLPDKRRFIPIQLPRLGKRMIPHPFLKPMKHVYDGQHYWEVNGIGTELGKILQIIRKQKFTIVKTYQVFENYRHRFFVLDT